MSAAPLAFWSTLPQQKFQQLAPAAIMVLLLLMVPDSLVIFVRSKFEREW